MAVVAEGDRRCAYLSPDVTSLPSFSQAEKERVDQARSGFLSGATPERLTGGTCYGYGLTTWGSLFTPRQLVALTTFSDLVGEARIRVLADATKAGLSEDGKGINVRGTGATAYADAVATYLAFAVDRSANYWSSLTPWGGGFIVQTFGRQALPMVWDFAEANPLSESTGNWLGAVDWITKCLETSVPAHGFGLVKQLDAAASVGGSGLSLVFTDPPYYDNISYADLSDFFYVWLRRSLSKTYSDLFSTLLTPKAQELVAVPYRFGGDKEQAKKFFERGLSKAFERMRGAQDPEHPLTVYYAFKQTESEEHGDQGRITGALTPVSTGWETMLEGLLRAGFGVGGTCPYGQSAIRD